MRTFKDLKNKIHVIDDAFIPMLPDGCIEITEAEADALRAPPTPTPEELAAKSEYKSQQDLKYAAKMDAIFTDIATDTIDQLVHKIEVQFPNPTFTNQQQKILKVCLVAASLCLRGS